MLRLARAKYWSLGAAYQAISRRSALLLLVPPRRTERDRLRLDHGKAENALRLPGMRLRLVPMAGPMRRLRRMEYARPGSRRGVEHLRREAQSAGRRAC